MSKKVEVYGWLDRRRHVLDVLEESIEQARRESQAKTGRGRDNSSRLEWSKTLIRLLELYDLQLEAVKRHIYGNSMPGGRDEPGEMRNGLVNFERSFQWLVQTPWGPDLLKLTCEDCGQFSDEVFNRSVPGELENGIRSTKYLDLCLKCYEKRTKKKSS